MRMSLRFVTMGLILTCCVLTIQSTKNVFAQVMQSTSYQMESDSVNFGGGLASSSNFAVEDTLGEIATGESGSASYSIKAGYQQMQEVYLAMTAAANVTMDKPLGGITGGNSHGTTTVTVTTDNRAGYQLSIQASAAPAMNDGPNSIADYDDEGTHDFSFITAGTDSHFGYTPEGNDVVDAFKDNGGLCGVGALETMGACWTGLTTLPVAIAEGGSSNHPTGEDTSVVFQVGIGGSVNQPVGTYTATTTLTLLPL